VIRRLEIDSEQPGVGSTNDAALVYEIGDGESVIEAVTAALRSVSGAIEFEVRPLYNTVDPDALDSLFAQKGDGTPRETDRRIVFEHGRYRVRVDSDGVVAVEPTEREPSVDYDTFDDGTLVDRAWTGTDISAGKANRATRRRVVSREATGPS